MASVPVLVLILILMGLLVAVSAVAGALWWRLRSTPRVEVARLAETLADRVGTLDALLKRLDEATADEAKLGARTRPSPRRRSVLAPVPAGPRGARRIDLAEPTAGPTLIVVPDLAASPPETAASASASADLARRFGAIWDLADSGASAEAIARRTGQPIGQVELILGLRRQLGSASATGAGAGGLGP